MKNEIVDARYLEDARRALAQITDAREELVAIALYAEVTALGDDPRELRKALAHIATEAREAIGRLKEPAS